MKPTTFRLECEVKWYDPDTDTNNKRHASISVEEVSKLEMRQGGGIVFIQLHSGEILNAVGVIEINPA